MSKVIQKEIKNIRQIKLKNFLHICEVIPFLLESFCTTLNSSSFSSSVTVCPVNVKNLLFTMVCSDSSGFLQVSSTPVPCCEEEKKKEVTRRIKEEKKKRRKEEKEEKKRSFVR